MGYHTDFEGKLNFKKGLTVEGLAFLISILGEDARNHPEWKVERELTRMNLMVTKELDGIVWNESEKTYDLEDKIELVIRLMTEKFPEFGLDGELLANGEEFDDLWKIIVKDNIVERKELKIEGDVIECPHCEEKFVLK